VTNIYANSQVAGFKEAALNENIDRDKQWLSLLHYKSGKYLFSLKSEVVDPGFFLSTEGSKSPEKELISTLEGMFTTQDKERLSEHVLCRFPARSAWLIKALSINEQTLPIVNCPELENWLSGLNPSQLVLVFPSYYMGRASSLFGHLFLRIDPPKSEKSTTLFSPTLNFSADTSQDSSVFENYYKGLVSGYPGVITIEPYYNRLRKYVDNENRDIWSYSLKMEQAELEFFLKHIWELQGHKFNYFFVNGNCAYRLLTLLQVVYPDYDFDRSAAFGTLPIDVVKVLNEYDLLEGRTVTPSQISIFKYRTKDLAFIKKNTIKAIIKKQKIPINKKDTNGLELSNLASLAYSYQGIKTRMDLGIRSKNAKFTEELVVWRSGLVEPYLNDMPQNYLVPPEKSHSTKRVSISTFESESKNFGVVSFRYLLHDLLDYLPGYQENTQLEFFNTSVLFDESDSKKLLLRKLKYLEIVSVPLADKFFKPHSWLVSLGTENVALGHSALFNYFDIGIGYSLKLPVGSLSFIPVISLRDKNEYTTQFDSGIGGMGLWRTSLGKVNFQFKTRKLISDSRMYSSRTENEGSANFSLQKNLSVFANYSNKKLSGAGTKDIKSAELGAKIYF
jgi:hypothetical protein